MSKLNRPHGYWGGNTPIVIILSELEVNEATDSLGIESEPRNDNG